MNVMSMKLPELDIKNVKDFGNLVDKNSDNEYEFECIVRSPKPTRDSFVKVLEMCRKKTCTSSIWKNIRDRSKSLDISVDTFRVTIFGKHHIEEYFKNDTLKNLPKGTWCVIEKSPVRKYDMSVGCKLNLKREKPIDPNGSEFCNILANWSTLTKTFRLKNRYSFLVDEQFSVDLTAVRSGTRSRTLRDSRTLSSREEYEIEIEYVPEIMESKKTFDITRWAYTLETVLCSYMSVWKIVLHTVLYDVEKSYYKTLLKKEVSHEYISKHKYRFKMSPNVISLNMERLRMLKKKAAEFYVTPKSDGLRMTGYIYDTGELFLIGSKSDFFHPTGIYYKKECVGSVFDGEMVLTTKNGGSIADYLIFDCYFDKKTDIRDKFLNERREIKHSFI